MNNFFSIKQNAENGQIIIITDANVAVFAVVSDTRHLPNEWDLMALCSPELALHS